MSRINQNVNSMLAQRILGQQNQSLNQSLERLSTGLAINRGADNPAGLIASENLRAEKAAISGAISNAERADQVMNIAEGGLQEINGLLVELQSLIEESANEAGLSRDEKEANQLQVDSILQSIDRIASTTSFQGVKLLNGTYDFTVNNQDANVADLQINAAKLGYNETRDVNIVVTQSAQYGGLYLSADANGGPGPTATIEMSGASDRFVFELAGAKGSREFTFASGTQLGDIVEAVNTFTSVTGVSASVSASGTGVYFHANEKGDDNFVQFRLVDDGNFGNLDPNVGVYNLSASNDNARGAINQALSAVTNPIRDLGQDIGAEVNGITATTAGNQIKINTDYLDLEVELTNAGSESLSQFRGFTITGGGADFNLGPGVNIINQVSVGITNVAARNLGTVNTGYLDDLGSGKNNNVVDGDLEGAQKIIDAAIDKVSKQRGRIGAFQKNVVGSSIRSLGVALENTTAAEAAIRDTDFAEETANLTRSQILVNAATNVLAISNSNPQNVLSLLG